MQLYYFVSISCPSFEQTFTQECSVLSLVEIGLVVLEARCLYFVNLDLLFRSYLPLENGIALYLNKKANKKQKFHSHSP